jgi:cytochrome P450
MEIREAADSQKAEDALQDEVRSTLGEWTGNDRSVFWSADRDAWVVTGYAEVAKILEEPDGFWRDVPLREGGKQFWGRHLLTLEGREHRRMHTLHMRLTSEAFAEGMRERAGKRCRDLILPLVEKGRGELAEHYADPVVFLVGCDFVGYDVTDASVMEDLRRLMQTRGTWKLALHSGTGISLESKVAQDGQAALKAMESILLPIIRERREQPRDDLISELWRKGPTVFPDWNEKDVLSTCWSSVDNETKSLLRGLLYILCRDRELQARLRCDPSLIAAFVEEGLRFLTPFRTMRRVVKKDIELAGQNLRAGDAMYLITPLANRDEEKWKCPYGFDAERQQESTHFAFGFGPGYCVGRYVARVEATEAIKALLAETSSFGLDPEADQPKWQGDMYHAVWPLNVILQK